MRIIIAGAGEVGYHLAKLLSSEAKDIYVIDVNTDRLNYIQSHIDVFTIEGDAKSIQVLTDAKVDGCDLLIAATSSEEVNFLVSVLGKKLGAKKTITRFNDAELTNKNYLEIFYSLGIDTIISPLDQVASEIVRLIEKPALTDDVEFEGGKLSVFGIQIDEHSKIIGKTIEDGILTDCGEVFRPIAIHRRNKTSLTSFDIPLRQKDIVYFIGHTNSIQNALKTCGKVEYEVRKIMILGGSRIGIQTAKKLQDKYQITLVEKDPKKCLKLAEQLKGCLILNIDGRDVASLEEEGLANMDAFIAVTGDSEINIMTTLVAKSHDVMKTIARVENIDYIHLSQDIGIDTLINKKMIAASSIFKHVRKGKVDAIAHLHGVNAEIIEFEINENTRVSGKQIKKIKFNNQVKIISIIRNNEILFPEEEEILRPGDKVITMILSQAIGKTENLFS
jgi:trk system potassium uptake protein TrkA